MLDVYTTNLLKDLLNDAQGNCQVTLLDGLDGKEEYDGLVKSLYRDDVLYNKFKEVRVMSFTVKNDKLIIKIV